MLLRTMLREEWRLHARLFGGARFAAFPALVGLLTAGALGGLAATGTDVGNVLGGLHALAFLFGLQTGALGLVSSDALDDLLGDVTLLLSAARTLPISRRRLYAVFLLKDALYYSVLFLLPVALAVGGFGVATGRPALARATPLLAFALSATFAAGLAAALTGIGLARRGVAGRAAVGAALLGIGGAAVAGAPVARLTPYALYAAVEPDAATATRALAPTLGVAVAGWLLFDPEAGDGGAARTAPRIGGRTRFEVLADRLPADPHGLAARNLLELRRSGGGVAKVAVSAGIVAGFAVGLLALAGRITGRPPTAPVAVGSLLGLTAFTAYNWLTQFDSLASYRIHPLSTPDAFRGKLVAFCCLLPVGGAFYVGAVAWVGGTLAATALGGWLYLSLSLYLLGVTTYLAGVEPNDFLFDTVLFAAFTAAVAAPLVPVLVVGLVVPLTAAVGVALALAGVGLAGVGYVLVGRAGARWERRLLAG